MTEKETSHGGARKGAGRPKGAANTLSTMAREEARATGVLPHEWLLGVVRGEPIEQRRFKDVFDKRGNLIGRELMVEEVYPDLAMRQDAAKAAAPYFAPRLATQVITLRGREDLLNSLTDEQLEAEIRQFEVLDKQGVIRKPTGKKQ
jgi:hypothetical protein